MTNDNFTLLLLPRQMARIESKKGITLKGGIEGNNKDKDDKGKRERKEVTHS